jgi:asparagine synthase (glutamine-hydrolysing)
LQRDYWSKGKLHSFSIGLDADAPDAVAARKVADLATEHHEIYFSVEEGKKIDKLIWHLETYDVTSIRRTPMYFLSKAISDLGIKVVLSGKGPMRFLEVIYTLEMPSAVEFQKESIERVQKLFTADLLRRINLRWLTDWRLEYRF